MLSFTHAMKWYTLLFLLSLAIQTASARPAQIILLRHGDKPDEATNPHLSAKGLERGLAFASLVTTNRTLLTNGLPVALFATKPTEKRNGVRASETLEPLAKELKIEVQAPFRKTDYESLARLILEKREYDGKTVVICWVHTYLPELARELGVKPKPGAWKKDNYDRVWVIDYEGDKANLRRLPLKLPKVVKQP